MLPGFFDQVPAALVHDGGVHDDLLCTRALQVTPGRIDADGQ